MSAGGFTPVYRVPIVLAGGGVQTASCSRCGRATAAGVPAAGADVHEPAAQRAFACAWNAPSIMLYA